MEGYQYQVPGPQGAVDYQAPDGANEVDPIQEELLELRRRYQEMTDQLIGAEEDNVRVSRALLEVKIEMNELKQKADAEKEQLLQRVLLAENATAEKAMAVRQKSEERDSTAEKLEKLEGILGEYQALKDNFKRVKQIADTERKRADETGLELLNVVNDKNNILKQLKTATADGTENDMASKVVTLEAEKAALLARVTETEQVFLTRLREVMEQATELGSTTSRSYRAGQKDGALAKAISDAVDTLSRYDARSDVMKEVEALRARVGQLSAENRKLQRTRSRQGVASTSSPVDPSYAKSNDRIRDLEEQVNNLLTQQVTGAGGGAGGGNTYALEREVEALTRTNDGLRGRVESLTASLQTGTGHDGSKIEARLQTENSKLSLSLQRAVDAQKRAESEAEQWRSRYQSMLKGVNGDGGGLMPLRHRYEDFASQTQAQLERERSELTTRAVKAETQLEEVQQRMERKIQGYQKEIKRLQGELSAVGRPSSSSARTPGAPRISNARAANAVPEPGPGSQAVGTSAQTSSSPKVMAHLSFGGPGQQPGQPTMYTPGQQQQQSQSVQPSPGQQQQPRHSARRHHRQGGHY